MDSSDDSVNKHMLQMGFDLAANDKDHKPFYKDHQSPQEEPIHPTAATPNRMLLPFLRSSA